MIDDLAVDFTVEVTNLAAVDLTASTPIVESGLSSTTLSDIHRPQ
jgi:hypothetical protein